MRKYFLFAICISFFIESCFSQNHSSNESTKGLQFILNYAPHEQKSTDAHKQNFSVVQGKDDRIYFGNVNGILVYDGIKWEFINANSRAAISLAINDNGRIFVGTQGDFGYLDTDSVNNLKFYSLLEFLPKEYKNFSTVWATYTSGNKVFFQSNNHLFRWENNNFKVWYSKNGYHTSYLINQQLYITERGIGLKKLYGNSLKLVTNGDYFKDKKIYSLLPFDNNQLIIATKKQGILLYDGKSFKPFKNDANKLFKNSGIYCGTLTPKNNFLFSLSRSGGVIVINKKGEIVRSYNQSKGLINDNVHYAYFDNQKNLWLALNNGIAKVDYHSPISLFNKKLGLDGNAIMVEKFEGKIVCGTSKGLFYLDNKSGKFVKYQGITSQAFSLKKIENELLIGSFSGIFSLRKNTLTQISNNPALSLCISGIDNKRFFSTSVDKLRSFYKKNGKWIEEAIIAENLNEIYKIEENKNGELWLQTYVPQIYKVTFPQLLSKRTIENPITKSFTKEDGMANDFFKIYNLYGKEVFESQGNIYKFNSSTQKFSIDSSFKNQFHKNRYSQILPLNSNDKDDFVFYDLGIYHNYFKKGYSAKKDGKKLIINELALNNNIENSSINAFMESDSIFWFCGVKNLIRYQIEKEKNTSDFSINIRKIFINGDSLIYGGYGALNKNPVISYENNALRIEYASTWFEHADQTLYQYSLEEENEGTNWSHWTKETKKDYTNLWEGNYTFRIRARNIHYDESNEKTFQFKILAPWYRTWFAYTFYFVFAFAFIWLVSYVHSMQLKRDNEKLELKVKQRTSEVREQSAVLENQAEELKVQAQRLQELDTLKSRLFANISHEFRTPLTLILSPIEKKLNNYDSEFKKSELQLIHRNAYQLLRLINQLLDLAKLESSKIKVRVSSGKILNKIKTLASSFYSLAETKKISYEIMIDEDIKDVYFDGDKIEKVINNLLSNAFKFTSENGKIIIEAYLINKKSPSDRSNREIDFLHLEVKDNGIGIPEETVEKIFDRFYQIDSSQTRNYEGTGIGLALSKELVKLHKGEINVITKEGAGSKFIVEIPVCKSCFSENEILDQEEILDDYTYNEYINGVSENKLNQNKEEEAHPPKEKPILLVVDDNEDIRNYIKESASKVYNCIEAFDGHEGINKAASVIPDIIVSDLMMPNMDGLTFCKRLKSDNKTSHIPIVLLTAKANVEAKIEGLQTGADDYITKPFNIDELLVRLNNLLTQRQKLKNIFSKAVYLKPEEVTVNDKDKEFLKKALQIVEEHIADTLFGVPVLEKELGLSRMQLHRKLKAMIGQPPGEFIKSIKLKRAAQLLSTKSLTVSEVAYDTGFSDPSYFTKVFRKQFGVPPTEYGEKQG